MSKKSDRKFFFSFRVTAYYMILVLLLLIPVLAYLKNFINSGISTSPADWGAFGDYFGGILNPIIGIASIVILGYISMKLDENSSETQREQFVAEQKMIAYNDIASIIWRKRELLLKIDFEIERMTNLDEKFEDEVHFREGDFIRDQTMQLSEYFKELLLLNSNIEFFPKRYDHIFDFDFNSSFFKEMIRLIKFSSNYYSYIGSFDFNNKKEKGETNNVLKLNAALDKFLEKLSSELIEMA